MKNNKKIIFIVAVFLFSLLGKRILSDMGAINYEGFSPVLNQYINYAFWAAPTFAAVLILTEFDLRQTLAELGFLSNPLKGTGLALAAMLPMMAGMYLANGYTIGIQGSEIFRGSLAAGIMEEYLFRGFLFGQLFGKDRLGFVPAILISSLLFGAGHLYQGGNLAGALGIMAFTALGGAWFGWLFIEWNRNIYLVMALHSLMNLCWILLGGGDNAIGNGWSNVFRAVTIAITVAMTIYHGRKFGFMINRGNILKNNNSIRDWE